MNELLPWLNLLLIPTFGFVLSIERRITRLEAQREAEKELRAAGMVRSRRTDSQPT